MKVVLFGSNGFIGSQVARSLSINHEVVTAARTSGDADYVVDLLDGDAIEKLLRNEEPEVVISCAGVVSRDEVAKLNIKFTQNIWEAIQRSGINLDRVITTGSAAEYGVVSANDLPVSEEGPQNPQGFYAEAKAEETAVTLRYSRELGVRAVVARVFNPIGAGMPQNMLLPNLIKQAEAIKRGHATKFEVSRLDAKRDYIDIRDIASAYTALVDAPLNSEIYNVASGKATETSTLVDILKELYSLPKSIGVRETADGPEPIVAYEGDITRIQKDTGWSPQYSIREALQGALDESNN